MALASAAAARAAIGACVLAILAALSGCEGTLGTSPPHAAPPNPVAEAGDARVELTWQAVTDATRYVILWDDNAGGATYENEITDIEATSFVHTGLVNGREHHYRIVAETSGGRGPESLPVSATPGPVAGAIELTFVRQAGTRHVIFFSPAENATHYRIYFAGLESQVSGRRPAALFVEADASPAIRQRVPVTSALFYRVIAMNDSRVGPGGPVAVSPPSVITEHNLLIAGPAYGQVNDDDCLDLPTATGTVSTDVCTGSFTARDLAQSGLADLAGSRPVSDTRFADFNGDGFDELFSNTSLTAGDPGSRAILHLNQGNGNFQASAAVAALDIAGVGGTLLAADFDNDSDVDLFAPNDHTRGDGARNWLLVNDGAAGFTDTAVAAGLATNPAGAAFIPRGGQAVDFNEDGFVDMFFGSRLLLNDGDGTFSDGSAAANVPVFTDDGLKLIDVDLDGDLDLVGRTRFETRLFRNTTGVFDSGVRIGIEPQGTFGLGLNVCDVNDDGYEDVIVARNAAATGTGTPQILLNIDGVMWESDVQEGTTSDPDSLVAVNQKIACGDSNLDGVTDVLARWGTSYRQIRASSAPTRRIRLRIVGTGGDRNQQGRIVRVVPQGAPTRIMTRVVESGSGLRAQNMYDLIVGAPWPGAYTATVRFAGGDVTTTLQAGDEKIIAEDGTVSDINPEEPE